MMILLFFLISHIIYLLFFIIMWLKVEIDSMIIYKLNLNLKIKLKLK